MADENKAYLGDGVYANFDGYHVILTTENGIETTNIVYLEEDVYLALSKYAEKHFSWLSQGEGK